MTETVESYLPLSINVHVSIIYNRLHCYIRHIFIVVAKDGPYSLYVTLCTRTLKIMFQSILENVKSCIFNTESL